MRAHMPSRSYKCYCFVAEQCELEREPTWLVGAAKPDQEPAGFIRDPDGGQPDIVLSKRRVSVFTTIYAGIYGFSDVDKRDRFVRQCNTSAKMREIAHVCSLIRES